MRSERLNARWAAVAMLAVALVGAAFIAGRATAGSSSEPFAGSGPRRTVDGITVGFAHSLAGADAAGAHYLLEIERAIDTLSMTRTDQVAGLIATPSEARTVAAHSVSAIALERSGGAPLRRVAVSTEMASYSRTAAQVTVLECWIYATAAREALWAIERVALTWTAGGWRVAAIDGAAPSADESLADLRAQLSFPGVGDASVR